MLGVLEISDDLIAVFQPPPCVLKGVQEYTRFLA